MRLRSYLLLMGLAILLPVMVLGISGTWFLADHEGVNYERSARDRTRAVLTAVDTALTGHGTSLRGLASSRHLESGDIEAFYEEAVRTLATQPSWEAINLSLPSGHIVLDTPSGSPLTARSFRDRVGFQRALSTGAISVGGLFDDEAAFFAVHLPVIRGEAVRHVLTALVDPGAILDLLAAQQLPPDWVGVVLDANHRVVARTVNQAQTLGRPGSASLRQALGREPEGWFRGTTLEGTDVYTPYSQSSVSGWTVALGIPTAAVTEATSQATRWMAGGVAGAMVLAIALAIALSRRIASPIASLASVARALGTGASVTAPRAGGILEVRELHQALANASRAVRDREDALRAADRAKDEFLAMLSHELRNPLGALASAAAVLQRSGRVDDRVAPAVAIVSRQVGHMTRLVDDLLDASRVTSGKISLSRRPVDLAAIVNRTLGALRSAGRLDGHDVRTALAPAWVRGDEARLEQVVSNLVENAVKYTPPSGRIVVRAGVRGDEATLEVEDTGMGLMPELTSRIFDLFVQGDRTLDRRSGGLGIGLTLVRRLAELHEGHVDVHSEGEGRGSVFTVVLPAIAPPDPHPDGELPRGVGAPPARRVLIVEDHEDARTSLRTGLEQHGYVLAEAADGPSGLTTAAAFEPDVTILDIGLPGMDGYEVARRMRQRPESARMLLIALTGYGHQEARQQALDAGFDLHVTKPVLPQRLADLIESCLAAAPVDG